MTKILIIYENEEPTNRLLVRDYSIAADIIGYEMKHRCCHSIQAEDINWCDIIISVRSTSNYEKNLSKLARRLGKYWITMLDDDFLSLGKRYGKNRIGYPNERKNNLLAILKNTDCLLATNKLLAEKYTDIAGIKKSFLSGTPIDENEMCNPGQNKGKVKIVFYVNDGTTTMFDQIIRPALPLLCDAMASSISLNFIALHPDLEEFKDKIEINYIPHMSFEDFKSFFYNSHFDIGIAPLDENGFSKYKYFNKYIEYTCAGIAGIYSSCELYKQVVTDGYNGILCENTPESWLNAIQNLVNNPSKRIDIANNAQQYAREHLTRTSIIERTSKNLPELYTYTAPEKKISKSTVKCLKMHNTWFQYRYYLFIAWSYFRSGQGRLFFSKLFKRITRK